MARSLGRAPFLSRVPSSTHSCLPACPCLLCIESEREEEGGVTHTGLKQLCLLLFFRARLQFERRRKTYRQIKYKIKFLLFFSTAPRSHSFPLFVRVTIAILRKHTEEIWLYHTSHTCVCVKDLLS